MKIFEEYLSFVKKKVAGYACFDLISVILNGENQKVFMKISHKMIKLDIWIQRTGIWKLKQTFNNQIT